MNSFQIFKDQCDEGESYTVYKDGYCIGTYLSDDELIKSLVNMGVQVTDGIDNRS